MASMGLIGAIGGAAQGYSSGLQSQLEEARQVRLEQLRTKNNQETNKLNNEQRHEFSLTELKARGEQQEGLLGKSDELARDRTEWERGLDPVEQYTDDTYGGVKGQRDRSNKFTALPTGASGNYRPANKVQEAEYLRAMGASEEEIKSYMMGSGDKPIMLPSFDEYGQKTAEIPHRFDGDGRLVPVPVGPAQSQGPAAPPSFKTRDEALSAAKARYPQADEATLLERLQSAYPHLFEE